MTRPWSEPFWARALCLLLVGGTAGLGCRRGEMAAPERVPPDPNAPALYGPPAWKPAGEASAPALPALPKAGTNDSSWQTAPFYCLQTELSPAVLFHSAERVLRIFSGLREEGLGAPTYLAWATMNGPRAFKRGEALDVTYMEECWVLVWWADAEGWTLWDSPWVVYLQHKPQTLTLDDDGLEIAFKGEAGDIVLMPLYGYEKLPPRGRDSVWPAGMTGRKVKTWDWSKTLPREPLTRVRYWAAVLREFPIHCRETYQVDRARDQLTVRWQFQWHGINDDWKTRPLRLAPISPALGLAIQTGALPIELSGRWFDLDLVTPYGPCLAIEGTETFTAKFPLLQYANETERAPFNAPGLVTPASPALEKLRALAARQFAQTNPPHAGTADAGRCQMIFDLGVYARALSCLDATIRSNAVDRLGKLLREQLGGTNPDACEENIIAAIWAYAHFAGDRALVKEQWPALQKRIRLGQGSTWTGFGRASDAALCGPSAACLAYARVAYLAGDREGYDYACYLFARSLIQLTVKMRGADYFRRHQPGHSLEFMDEEVFLTRHSEMPPGWRMDGPRFPARGEREFEQRWNQFLDVDIARFLRDYLKPQAGRELSWMQHRAASEQSREPDLQAALWRAGASALVLNEGPAGATNPTAIAATGDSGRGEWARCLTALLAGRPLQYQRLIPPGEPTSFLLGCERELPLPDGNPFLITRVDYATSKVAATNASNRSSAPWPRLTWPRWKTPGGAAWSFGQVRPVGSNAPARLEVIAPNWNTRVLVYR